MPEQAVRPKIHSGTQLFPLTESGVDHNLVRTWLGLPPGSWPPDHYTLLGLPAGRSEAAAVEPLVLDRMDRLRQHQLLHPELVTEGMNRLAQALITLTDSLEKSSYDIELGIAAIVPLSAAPQSKAPELPQSSPLIVAQPVIEQPEEAPVGIRVDADDTLIIESSNFEVHAAVAAEGTLGVSEAEHLHEPRARSTRSSANLIEAVALSSGRPRAVAPASRRWIYARLALLREAIRSWERLRSIAMVPDNPIATPGTVLILLEAASGLRPLLPKLRGVLGDLGEPGSLTVLLVRQPLALDVIRRLLPEQRHRLSKDWQDAQRALHEEYARLRQLSLEARSELSGPSVSIRLWRSLRDNPEWILFALVLLLLLISLTRSGRLRSVESESRVELMPQVGTCEPRHCTFAEAELHRTVRGRKLNSSTGARNESMMFSIRILEELRLLRPVRGGSSCSVG